MLIVLEVLMMLHSMVDCCRALVGCSLAAMSARYRKPFLWVVLPELIKYCTDMFLKIAKKLKKTVSKALERDFKI